MRASIWVIVICTFCLLLVLNSLSYSAMLEGFRSGFNEFPKEIFQTWKSKTEFPDNYRFWKETWTQHNPEYKYVLFDDNDNREFIQTKFSWFLTTFDSYKKNVERADAIRYFYLYVNGGIYADMDFECLKEFDSLLEANKDQDILLGSMETNGKEFDDDNSIPNAIMISKPRQKFWLYVIHELNLAAKAGGTTEQTTGPVVLKRALEKYKKRREGDEEEEWYERLLRLLGPGLVPAKQESRIKVFEPEVFYAISWSTDQDSRVKALNRADYKQQAEEVRRNYPKAYAVTYWTHNW